MTQTKPTFEGYFLSPRQTRVWNRHLQGGNDWRSEFILRFEGDLSLEEVKKSVEKVFRRQESLRSSFQISPDFAAPLQIVGAEADFVWNEFQVEPKTGEDEILKIIFGCFEKDFSIFDKPQFFVAKPENGTAFLGVSLSFLMSDGETANVLAKEIFDELAKEKTTEVISAVQFAALENELFDSDENASERLFWKDEVSKINFSTPFLANRKIEKSNSAFIVKNIRFDFSRRKITEICQQYSAEKSDIFLAAWTFLATRFLNEDKTTIFYETDGRIYAELENLVARCAKNLPLNFDFEENLSVSKLIEKTVDKREEAENNQEYFNPANLPEKSVACGFTFQQYNSFVSKNLRIEVISVNEFLREADLCLRIVETNTKFFAELHFQEGYLSEILAEEMLRSFVFVLEQICENPALKVAEIDLLHPTDKENLRKRENRTRRETAFRSLPEMFTESAANNKNQTAIITEKKLTFAEFEKRINRLANFLLKSGVKNGDVVAVLLPHSAETLTALLAVSKIGATYLPLETSMPKERLEYVLADSKTHILLTETDSAKNLAAENLTILKIDKFADEIGKMSETLAEISIHPLQIAYIIYTSGSTGKPKGVAVTHAGLTNYLIWACEFYRGNSQNGAPLHSSVAFDMAVTSCFVPLLNGKSVCLTEKITAEDPSALLEVWRRENGFDFVKLTPAHAKLLGGNLESENARKAETLILGGEALNVSDVEFFRQNSPETLIVNEYGPTETVVGCAIFAARAKDLKDENIPIGKPIDNTQIYVLDSNLKQVLRGVIGEIFIGGKGVAQGYLGQSALTAEKFVPDPFSNEGARLYRTGDLAVRREDGNLIYLGRGDSQIKVRGFRVELGEIESALCEIENVSAAAVIAEKQDSESLKICAFVVPKQAKETISTKFLFERLAEKLPEPMIPAQITVLEKLPLNQNGKIDRRKLSELSETENEDGFNAPRTNEEQILAGIWTQILKLKKVGIDDKYFALGGDSIRSIQIIASARRQGIEISIEQLFRLQTIRRICEELKTDKIVPPLKVAPFELISETDREKIPDGIESAYPLSRLQSGMIFHRELAPESAIYHDVFGYHLKAPLDVELLREAVKQLVARHPAMRTAFELQEFSEPLQIVHLSAETPFEVEDISHLAPDEQEKFLLAFLEAEKNNHFDYAKPPLLRFYVHIRTAETFQFWISFHHAIIDGWSDISLLVELGLSYGQLLKGEEISFQTPETHYRDFVALERESLADEEHREFWRKSLDGSEFLRVPRLFPNNFEAETTLPNGVHIARAPLAEEVSKNLFHLSQKLAMPLKSILMAAHLKVLQSVTGRKDVLTGLVSVGRPETADAEKVLGLHLNSLPFRAGLNGGTWRDLIAQAFETEREMIPYRRFPLAEIQNMSGGERITETLFYFTHYYNVLDLEAVPELEIYGWYGFEQSSFPLITHSSVNTFNSSVEVSVIGDKKEFSLRDVERLSEIYARALNALNAAPDSSYKENLLSADEQAVFAEDFNSKPLNLPNIKEVFEVTAAQFAQRDGLVWEDGKLTYEELNTQANKLSRYLQKSGIAAGDCFAIAANRSKDVITAILAALKIGAAYLPFEVSFPAERIALMCRESNAKLILTNRGLTEKLSAISAEKLYFEDLSAEINNESGENLETSVSSEDVAYIMFTSGSTGEPKAVAVPHRAVVRLVKNSNYADLSENERILQLAPLSFDASVFEIFGALLNGGTLCLFSQEADSSRKIGQAIKANKITTVWLTAGLFNLMVDENLADLENLRQILAGGDALSLHHVQKFLAENESVKLINGYGPTENTTFTCCQTLNEKEFAGGKVPIGRAIGGTKVYILDKNLEPLPAGAIGEIFAGGAGLAHGYLNNPDLTAEKFIPNPFSADGERLYRTGDAAFYDPDGTIHFVGRSDKQVKIRGFRIEPAEIEAVLRRHEQISDCVVAVRKTSAGEKFLCVYIVAENEPPDFVILREYLKESLPDFMIPAAFSRIEKIPLTVNGKTDFAALPEPSANDAQIIKISPETLTEQKLYDIWREILEESDFGVNEDFFTLGGHSLRAMQMINRIREAFETEIPLKAVFEFPTIRLLSEKIDSFTGNKNGEIKKKSISFPPRTGDISLTSAQERLWFLEQLDAGSAAYNIPLQIKVAGKVDLEILEKSIEAFIFRHEILRTAYFSDEGVPKAKIESEISFKLETVEIAEAKSFDEIALDFVRQPFDLSRPPLIRALFFKTSEAGGTLLIVLHHIISDAWSISITVREIAETYALLSKGIEKNQENSLFDYADYAIWQKQWLAGEEKDKAISFWKQNLAGIQTLELPTDFPRPERQTHKGAKHSVEFTAELSEKLGNLATENNSTLFNLLLAVFSILLGEYSKQSDIAVGTDIANRNFQETEKIVGLFVNQLVLRSKIDRNEIFSTLLKRVHENTLDAFEHRELPFAKVVEAVKPGRNLRQNPLFQVLFVLQNTPLPKIEIEDLSFETQDFDAQTTAFDLSLHVWQKGDVLRCTFRYSTDLFAPATIEGFAEDFRDLCFEAAENGNSVISEITAKIRADKEKREAKKVSEIRRAGLGKLKALKQENKS